MPSPDRPCDMAIHRTTGTLDYSDRRASRKDRGRSEKRLRLSKELGCSGTSELVMTSREAPRAGGIAGGVGANLMWRRRSAVRVKVPLSSSEPPKQWNETKNDNISIEYHISNGTKQCFIVATGVMQSYAVDPRFALPTLFIWLPESSIYCIRTTRFEGCDNSISHHVS